VVRELESFGQLKVIAEFSKRQIDYFHSLPPELRTPESVRNGAVAMVHYARVMRNLGDLDSGTNNANEAIALLEDLQSRGDRSDASAIGLAMAYAIKAAILDNRNDAAGEVASRHSLEILAPVAEAPQASPAARRAYIEVLVRRGFELGSNNRNDDAVRTEQQAMDLATRLGAREEANYDMAAIYAEAAGWQITALSNLGRNDEARRIGEDALALSDRILAARPGFRLALHAQQINIEVLSSVAQNDLDPAAALRYGLRGEQISAAILRLDLNSFVAANNLGVAHQGEGDAHWAAGRLKEALPYYLKALDDFRRATSGGSNQTLLYLYQMTGAEYPEARAGDFATAESLVAETAPYIEKLHATEPAASIIPGLADALAKSAEADIAFERDDSTAARRLASEAVKLAQAIKPQKGFQEIQTYVTLYIASDIAGHADYLQGDYAAAETAERLAVESRKKYLTDSVNDMRDVAIKSTWLAMALARGGKIDEAAEVIGPMVHFERDLAAKNHGDQWVPVELAGALYAEALADKAQSAALLREAARLLEGTAPAVRETHDVRLWREWILKAQQPRQS
jgi:tetratricopeptide (TPR) repeat protein